MEKALAVSNKEEGVESQMTEREEREKIEDSSGPLILNDTAWLNIHGGPKEMILEHLRNTQEFPEWTKPAKGILLYGPPGENSNFFLQIFILKPGVGKTLVARAICETFKGEFFNINPQVFLRHRHRQHVTSHISLGSSGSSGSSVFNNHGH